MRGARAHLCASSTAKDGLNGQNSQRGALSALRGDSLNPRILTKKK